MKKTKGKYNIKLKDKKNGDVRATLVLDVSGKKEISIVRYDIEKINDEEYKKLLNSLNNVNREIRSTYYASNTAIDNVNNRGFFDLVKIFFSKMGTPSKKEEFVKAKI